MSTPQEKLQDAIKSYHKALIEGVKVCTSDQHGVNYIWMTRQY